MKATVVCSLILFACMGLQAKHTRLTLEQAIQKKVIDAKAVGAGGYQGYCLNFTFRSRVKDSLLIIVEAGRRMDNTDEGQQDILIVKEERVYLKGLEEKKFPVKGYCCQARNRGPGTSSKFAFKPSTDSALMKIGRYLSGNKFNGHLEQQAVWAISEKRPAASVTDDEDSLAIGLRMYVAGLRGEKLPWYNVVCRKTDFSGGSMATFPVLLRGKVKFQTSEPVYYRTQLTDEQGLPVCTIIYQWSLKGENEISLQLPVKGIAKGKYRVEMMHEDKLLFSEQVEL